MENLNENDYQRNYDCLLKIYNFQELIRTSKIKKDESDKLYLINPESLLNYDKYCNCKELKSIFENNRSNKINNKSKNIDITKLPIIKQKNSDEIIFNDIRSIYKIKYRNKEINLSCYNKIIIVNEEIQNLMTNITNFTPEKIIFIQEHIAILLKENILELFKYDNNKRICKPRYIIIFEDKLYTDRELKQLNTQGLINYLYNKNIKDHIVHEILYEKEKKIGEITNLNEIYKEIKLAEKEKQKQKYLIEIENKSKINQENQLTYRTNNYENKIKIETNESRQESINLKSENNINIENNNKYTNKTNNNISISKEEIIPKEEKSKERSIKYDFEENIKNSNNFEAEEIEEDEKKESQNIIDGNNNKSQEDIRLRESIDNKNENGENENENLSQNIKMLDDEKLNEDNKGEFEEFDEVDKINLKQSKQSEKGKNIEENVEKIKEKEEYENIEREIKKEEENENIEKQKQKEENIENNKDDEITKQVEEKSYHEDKNINDDKIIKENDIKKDDEKLNEEEKNYQEDNKKEEKFLENEMNKEDKKDEEEQRIKDEEKIIEEQKMKEEERIKEEENIREEQRLKEEQRLREEEKIKEEQKIKEEERLKEEQKIIEENKLREEKSKEEENNIIDNINKNSEENDIKNAEKEIQKNLLEEELQRKKIEEEIKKKLKEEEMLLNQKQEEIKNLNAEEEIMRKNIEEKIKQESLDDEILRKNIQEKNGKNLENEVNNQNLEIDNKKDEEELKSKKEEEENINNSEKEKEDKFSKKEEKNKEDDEKYKNSHFIESLKEDPKIGLTNIGATCYMNATIQCFSRTTHLSNYFLNKENISKFTENKKLSHSYFNLIFNLWHKQDNSISYSPYDFKNIISEMNPLFQGIAANDSKDLILFILQQLHEELKLEINGKDTLAQNDEIVDQTNRQAVFEEFAESMKYNVSIISELFFGKNEIISDCLNCREKGDPIIKYNFQIFNFIIFSLKEVSNYKKYKLGIVNNNSNNINDIQIEDDSVTIYDCFEQFVLPVIMTGDNMMFCNKCQQLSPTSYTTKIYSAPNILILILNRGKGNEFKIRINFEQIISIGKYVEQKEDEELKYELYGVLTHLGSSDMSGHFIAFCYSVIDKVWYKFNDAFVDQVSDFQKEVHDFEDPYILFYKKIN